MADEDVEEPEKKKICISAIDDSKRRGSSPTEEAAHCIKRLRVTEKAEAQVPANMRNKVDQGDHEQALAAQRRWNFLTACERVSYEHFTDHRRRLLLPFPPACVAGECLHKSTSEAPSEMAIFMKEAFRIDYKSHMWCDALHVAMMAIRPDTYLSADMLQYIVEVILNAHHDIYSGFTIAYLLERCQQVFALMYRTHPPCASVVRKCYKQFLMSPMAVTMESFSDRSKFGCEKGIITYCVNRLEYEITSDIKDGPLIDRKDYVTEEMTQTIKGLQWQKDKLDIFETLDRSDRIKRLIIVLNNLVELLTSDLSIWFLRHRHNQSQRLLSSSHRPLLANYLWPHYILYTGSLNDNCLQIISLFVKFVHCRYPKKDVQVVTKLLNALVQIFYICEKNSSGDYPHTGKYCSNIADELYKASKYLPTESVIAILKEIKPTFMRHLVGIAYIKGLLHSKDDNILIIMRDFLENEEWKNFSNDTSEETNIQSSKIKTAKKAHHIYVNFSKMMKDAIKNTPMDFSDVNEETYPKFKTENNENHSVNQKQIIEIVMVTLDAYFDAYSVEKFQDTLNQMSNDGPHENQNNLPYALSKEFHKRYRNMYRIIKEIRVPLRKLQQSSDFQYFKNFETISRMLGV